MRPLRARTSNGSAWDPRSSASSSSDIRDSEHLNSIVQHNTLRALMALATSSGHRSARSRKERPGHCQQPATTRAGLERPNSNNVDAAIRLGPSTVSIPEMDRFANQPPSLKVRSTKMGMLDCRRSSEIVLYSSFQIHHSQQRIFSS